MNKERFNSVFILIILILFIPLVRLLKIRNIGFNVILFNSWQFFLFLLIVALLYFIFPYRHRWIVLLLASYYFYICWKPEYGILLIISTCIDYFSGIMMGREELKEKRKKYLIISIISNLGLLFTFKYYNFFNLSITSFLTNFNIFYNLPYSQLLLPVGISFYTFQTLSYSIDVYHGKINPEKRFGIFALYVVFFPQLVAGPIERASRLLPQFYNKYDFDYKRVTDGLKLIVWGLFKKVVIADRLSVFVEQVYGTPYEYQGISLIIATVFFAFQIYCDFSGYSDIAIGSAQILGFKLMDNFRRPYFSKSIPEFWQRWHISLSTWFRDYLYIPLGGNRVGKWRWYFNLFITFLISGLWHGANWTFVIWGALNGTYILLTIWSQDIRNIYVNKLKLNRFPYLYKILQVATTFSLTCFAWVFFRAKNLSEALYISKNLFAGIKDIDIILTSKELIKSNILLGQPKEEFIIAILAICFMETVHMIQRHESIRHMLSEKPVYVRWAIYYILIFSILFFGVFNSTQFIYFQF